MLTVLITCALGDYMESTIKCMKNNFENRKIRVIGTDVREMQYNFNGLDAFFKVPLCSDYSYLDAILSICKKEKVDVVIPTNTVELEDFERNKLRFEKIGAALLSAGSSLNLVNSKDGLLNLMQAEGIEHVPSEVIEYAFQAESFILKNGIDKTYCIKQLNSCGARGFKILTASTPRSCIDKGTNRIPFSALNELLEEQGPMLIQEYLDGSELTVDMLCDKGKVLYSIVKKNNEMINGVAQISSLTEDSYAESICAKVVKAASLCGNVGFDVKYSSQGKPFIIDCNPRLTATVSLSDMAGINLPYLGIKYALGEPIPKLEKNDCKPVCIRRTKDYFFDRHSEDDCLLSFGSDNNGR